MRTRLMFVLCLLPAASVVHAQQWLVNSVIQNQIVETAICDSALKKGEKLPDVCAKYAKYSGAMKRGSSVPRTSSSGQAGSRSTASAKPAAAGNAAALRFTPTGDDGLRKVAEGMATSAEQRQQLAQIFSATKTSFEQRYGDRGWRHNVAGAYAFFIGSMAYVWSGNEPEPAAQDRLFDALATALAGSADLAGASNAEKAALYDTLIASASLPLVLYVDGTKTNNAKEIEQARTLAAQTSRKIMKSEPDALVAMIR